MTGFWVTGFPISAWNDPEKRMGKKNKKKKNPHDG